MESLLVSQEIPRDLDTPGSVGTRKHEAIHPRIYFSDPVISETVWRTYYFAIKVIYRCFQHRVWYKRKAVF